MSREQWVNVAIAFKERGAWLTVSRRDLFFDEKMRAIVHRFESNGRNPEALASEIKQLLTEYRPELQNCSLALMDMGGYPGQHPTWRFLVFHESLPSTQMGAVYPEMPLKPEVPKDLNPPADLSEFFHMPMHNSVYKGKDERPPPATVETCVYCENPDKPDPKHHPKGDPFHHPAGAPSSAAEAAHPHIVDLGGGS